MGRIIRFSRDRHQEAQQLLPWYATGQLQDEERNRVEAHMRDCPECRAELALERRLAGAVAELPFESEQGWAAMRRRIEAQAERPTPLARWRKLFAPEHAGWLAAAQITAVLMVAGVVLPLAHAPRYHALGAVRPAAVGDVIVIFRPEASAEAVTEALRANGARLVDGPTAADAYVLDVPLSARRAALARLRTEPAVELAEPIDPTPRP